MAEQETTKAPTPEATAAAAIDVVIAQQDAPAESTTAGAGPKADPKAEKQPQAAAGDTRAPEAPTLTDAQRQAAKHLGYSDEELAELTPREVRNLERESTWKRRLESQNGNLQQQLEQLKGKGKPGDAKPKAEESAAPEAEPEPPAEGEEAAPTDPSDDLPEITSDDDMDAIVTKHNALRAAVLADRKDRAALRDELQALRAEAQAPVAKQVASDIDEFFTGLDSEIFEFGGKKFSQMEQGTPQRETASRVIVKARKLLDVHEGDPGWDDLSPQQQMKQCLEESLAIVAKDQYRKSVEKPIREKVHEREAGSVARPSGTYRKEQTVSDEERAAQEIEAEATRKGIPLSRAS